MKHQPPNDALKLTAHGCGESVRERRRLTGGRTYERRDED